MITEPKAKLSWGYSFFLAMLLSVATITPPQAHTQGCAQCRDTLTQAPARTRQAYRHGIEVLVLAAGGVFLAFLTVIRRYR